MRLPESPKFLLAKGRYNETIDCLKFVYRWNNKSDEKFPVSLTFYSCLIHHELHSGHDRGDTKELSRMMFARFFFFFCLCFCFPRPMPLQVTSVILPDYVNRPCRGFFGGLYESTVGLFTSTFRVAAIITCVIQFCATTR